MKAYCCKERDGDEYAVIVYGKTRGQAKREGASELHIHLLDANVSRLPWADEYGSINNLPLKVYFENGWFCECCKCGRRIDVDSEYTEGTLGKFDYLCDECRKAV